MTVGVEASATQSADRFDKDSHSHAKDFADRLLQGDGRDFVLSVAGLWHTLGMTNKSNRLAKSKQAASKISGAQIEWLATLNAKQAVAAGGAISQSTRGKKHETEQHPKRRRVEDVIHNDVRLAFTRAGAEADTGRKMTDEEWQGEKACRFARKEVKGAQNKKCLQKHK